MNQAATSAQKSAVVFAYHNVGVRCLSVLLAGGVDIRLVVTHQDDPKEEVWFESVATIAARHGIPIMTPDDPNTEEVIARIQAEQPDFFFSFYYRKMLNQALLAVPREGAFNMHGSLLPKYRGRVPVNWAVIMGETETGASLHEMTLKPDQGALLGQQRVPILPNDTAFEVFQKVTWAAEIVLENVLSDLLHGKSVRTQQNLAEGNYCYGRKPEDGRIDWSQSLQDIHNLVRGVAPPYPGAFTELAGIPARILRTQMIERSAIQSQIHAIDPRHAASAPQIPHSARKQAVVLHNDAQYGLWVDNGSGPLLAILALDLGNHDPSPQAAASRLPKETILFDRKDS
jgi:methionyl-tRNA formyltransferase